MVCKSLTICFKMVKRIKSQLKTIIPHLKKGKLATSIPLRVFTKLSLHKHYIFIIAKRKPRLGFLLESNCLCFMLLLILLLLILLFPITIPNERRVSSKHHQTQMSCKDQIRASMHQDIVTAIS